MRKPAQTANFSLKNGKNTKNMIILNTMRIGFYFECFKRSGGTYQYALNLLDALRETGYPVTIFNISPDFPFEEYKLPNWKVINIIRLEEGEKTQQKEGMLDPRSKTQTPLRKFKLWILKVIRYLHLYKLEIFLTRKSSSNRVKNFKDLDLMFYHGPSELSFLTNIPGVVPIHDLHHRNIPPFPEMTKFGQYIKREYLFKNITKRAWKILVDSNTGKGEIIKYYGVEKDHIIVFPPLGPNYLKKEVSQKEKDDLRAKYNLPEKFLFYPAQFWPHKNHQNIVRAVKILKDRGIIAPLVFVGSKQDTWGESGRVIKLTEELGLHNQIYFLGYTPNEEMRVIYSMAEAMLMTAFVGWTYIPVPEAWFMECPVIYSTAKGCEEQGGDAALFPDPCNPQDIADKIQMLWGNEELRKTLINNGNKKLASWTKKDVAELVKKIIQEFELTHNK